MGHGHDHGATTGFRHECGHRLELVRAAGRDHYVGASFGQRHRSGGAYASTGTGDDCDLVVEAKAVEDHEASPSGMGRP